MEARSPCPQVSILPRPAKQWAKGTFRPTIASPLFSASLGGRAAAREASAGTLSPFHARALGARRTRVWGGVPTFQCCRTPPFFVFLPLDQSKPAGLHNVTAHW